MVFCQSSLMSEVPPGIYCKKKTLKKTCDCCLQPINVSKWMNCAHQPSAAKLGYWSRSLFARLKRHSIGMEKEMERWKKSNPTHGGSGCQGHEGSNNAQAEKGMSQPDWWTPAHVFLPGDKRKASKKKKNTWVKWFEKERLRSVATFVEEMAFLCRRHPVCFIWWDGKEVGSGLKKVWRRPRYGGWSRSKGR